MVPSRVLVLDAMPLTANGKLDRKALPEPDFAGKSYVAPRSEIEVKLASIWQEVLGLAQVGVTDNFFELGGDSIVSIQVVSRARQAGLKLTPKDIFQHQTLEALARVVSVAEAVTIDQGVVTGDMALTPVQHWFFEQAIPERHHWNQSVLLRLREPLEKAALEEALHSLVRHHDALRLRYRCDEGGRWTQSHATLEETKSDALLWERQTSDASEIEGLCTEAQKSLDLTHGPLLRALHIKLLDGGERLLLVIHHVVVDGVSWRVLLEDLQQAYAQRLKGEAIGLPAKTSSFKAWSEALSSYVQSEALQGELAYWLRQVDGPCDLPCDHADGSALIKDGASISLRLDKARTSELLKQAPEAYRTQINDLLLTALSRVLCRWSGEDSVLLDLEGHGREDLFESVDLSRTVGWFTTIFPVRLRPSVEMGASIKAVKEQLRAIPNKGLGYGLLKYLGAAATRDMLQGRGEARITFNYLGQFDQSFDKDEGLFVPANESDGLARSSEAPLGSALSVSGQVYNGELRLGISYSREMYEAETIAALAEDYRSELEALIDHCLSDEAGGLTPSDVPLAKLTQTQLDALVLNVTDIEDLYPLSPMQQGMLFHALHTPEAGFYDNQLSVDIEGLDVARFKAAWHAVAERHDILRTSFIWDGVPQPLQIVHKVASEFIEEIDWRNQNVTPEMLEELNARERQHRFDLTKAHLQRLIIVHLNDDRHHMIWKHHHLLTDGWSTSRVIGEVLRAYWGEAPSPYSGRYRDYIAWLEAQDKEAAKRFWSERLVQLDAPTLLEFSSSTGAGSRERYTDMHDATSSRLLQRQAACGDLRSRQRITLNTLVQAAWLLLLRALHRSGCGVFRRYGRGAPSQPARIGRASRALHKYIAGDREATPEQSVDELAT